MIITSASLSISARAAEADGWVLPVASRTLINGLVVVVSEDHSSPTVGVSVVYRVGMRLEPRNRTGFAHLFEHLMFQGTPRAPKGVFDKVITGGGGRNNGSTRPDFTNYVETAPVSALDALLWLEADRMQTLDFNEATLANQRDVVKEEIRVNVKNQPYGAFYWLDIAGVAFSKWANNHDGYGSFEDLEGASLTDVRAFHRDYYGPNNAVLAIAGDIKPAQAFALAQKYFGSIRKRPTPPVDDFSEPLNALEQRVTQTDALAQVPAIAVGWKMPERQSSDLAPMAVLVELLAGSDASMFYQGLVKGREIALNTDALVGITSPWEYDGPTLFTVFARYKPTSSADAMLAGMEDEIAKVIAPGIDVPTLQRVKTRMLADWYNRLESFIGRADAIARLQTIWGDAQVVNQVPDWIKAVTADDLKRVATRYLTRANRTVIDRRLALAPAPAAASAAPASAPASARARTP